MRHSNIILGGVVSTLAVAAASTTDEHQRALQRQIDLNDKSPLSDRETNLLKGMFERGAIKMVKGKKGSQRTRALKKHGDTKRKAPTPAKTPRTPAHTPRDGHKEDDYYTNEDDTSYYDDYFDYDDYVDDLIVDDYYVEDDYYYGDDYHVG